MADLIQNNSQIPQTNILASYLRNDRLHQAKNINGTNLRKLLLGLAEGLLDFNNNLNIYTNEADIRKATNLIEEWERTFGIPDCCLKNEGTLQERRNNILIKLAGLQGTLIEQFEYVINLLGYSGIQVVSAFDYAQIPTPIPTPIFSLEGALFTIYIILPENLKPNTIPSQIPTPLFSVISILECIFNKLKPANVKLIFTFPFVAVDTSIDMVLENGSFLVGENNNLFVFENA
jgi:uncharacterized protein YmfQ (DUF2313 family)